MKKRSITIILTVLILVSPLILSAQTKDLNYTKVSDFILHNYHPDSATLSKLCRRACIFIKFKVDEKGLITNLSFSKDSISFIKEALTKAINALQKDPELMETLKRSGKTIIQPFMYYYQEGCDFPKMLSETPKEKEDEKSKNKKSYYGVRDDMEFFGATLWDMLNFDDGKLEVLDGIILSPIRVSSGSME
ncbi:MAG: hypothetical protein JWR09_833 [Mucilaginibacter sp.]|nr:hypothetical protein [Mucilaginibacter sp.]